MDAQDLKKQGFSDHKAIAKAVREAMKGAAPKQIRNGKVVTVVPEPQLFRKIVMRPDGVAEADLREFLQAQEGPNIPDVVDISSLDFQSLTTLTTPDGSTMREQLMVVCAPIQTIQDHIEVAKQAHIHLQAIEPKGGALVRLHAPDQEKAMLIVDIGSESSAVLVARRGVPWIVSTVNVGGNIIRNPETLELVEDEVMRKAALERLSQTLLMECEQVVSYYMRQFAVGTDIPSQILATGGGSMIEGMLSIIAEQSRGKYDVVPAPTPAIDIPPFCDRRFMGAIGAALRNQPVR